MKVMVYEEIVKLHTEARKKVRVACDEYHAHSALGECLDGDPHALQICKLAETIYTMRALLTDVVLAAQKLGIEVRSPASDRRFKDIAFHASGQCNCKSADDCRAIIRGHAEDRG